MTKGYIEPRANSIRVAFNFEGKVVRKTLRINGVVAAPTPANLNVARRLLKLVNAEILAGTFVMAEHFPDNAAGAAAAPVPAEGSTFGALADLWLESQGRLVDSTQDQYGSAVRFWKRLFGADSQLDALTHKVVVAKVGGYDWSSAEQHNNYMIALRGIFGLEYRGARAAENPVADIGNMPRVKRPPDPLTTAERDRVLADLAARYDPRIHAYFEFLFYTGMRPEEAIALRWSDIDFASATARVQRVRTFKGSERDSTKTNKVRDVDLMPPALAALQAMKSYTFLARAEREREEDDAADVFQNPVTGRPWHDERSQRDHYWKPSLKRLGIRARRAYCTRHTYCTVALMAGVPAAYIAMQAGHSVKMLLDTYARWIPGGDGGAARALLEAAMSGQLPRNSPESGEHPYSSGITGRRDWTRTKKSGNGGV